MCAKENKRDFVPIGNGRNRKFNLRLLRSRATVMVIIGFLTLSCALALFWIEPSEAIINELLSWGKQGVHWLQDRPLLLFGATAILPGVGFPVTPLLIAAGATGIPKYGMVLANLFTMLAITVCMVWNYWVARSWFRKPVGRMLKRRTLPEGVSGNFTLLAIVLRITPGVPFVFQNYFLGFMKLPFPRYLLISTVVQGIYTPVYVITGGALIQGHFKIVVLTVSIIVLLGGVTYLIRHRLEKRKNH